MENDIIPIRLNRLPRSRSIFSFFLLFSVAFTLCWMELKEVEESKNDVISEVVEMNRRGKKRKSRRKREKITEQATVELPDPVKEVVLQDPLEVFGGDIMLMIVRNLDARSVVLSLLVSRGWHSFASSDSLWTSKVFLSLYLSLFSFWIRFCLILCCFRVFLGDFDNCYFVF